MVVAGPFLLRGAKEICDAVGESPRDIKRLVEEEGLPAWKRSGHQREPWKASPQRLAEWAAEQDVKYTRRTRACP